MPEEIQPTSSPPWQGPLPKVQTPLEPSAVFDRLMRSSQRGQLPGFRDALNGQFEASAFGSHFDRTLVGEVAPTDQGSAIAFNARRHLKALIAVWVVFLLTLWPGVWLTHSMLLTWFGWYRLPMWGTTAWYVPLTLLCIPALLKVQRSSDAASWQHAQETISKIAKMCDGATTLGDS